MSIKSRIKGERKLEKKLKIAISSTPFKRKLLTIEKKTKLMVRLKKMLFQFSIKKIEGIEAVLKHK